MTPLPYARLSAFYFAYYAALGAFTPYWSLYLDARGIAPATIGGLMGLWYATRIFSPSLWGLAVARARNPALWLRAGCVATMLAFAAFLFPLSTAGVALAMVLFCALFNAVMPQFESLTLSHLAGRAERYGSIRVWGSLGFVTVVAAFGWLFEHRPYAELPWWMLPLFAALAFVSFRTGYGPALAQATAGDRFRSNVMRREVLMFLLFAFLMQVSFGPYYTFFSLYLKHYEYRSSMVGAFWALGVVLEILVFAFAAPLFARIPARRMIVLALSLAAVRWALTALAPRSLWVMLLAQLTHAITFGGFYAACMQLMAEYFPGRSAGHGQGVFYGFSSGVGGVVGALLAGQGWAWYEGRVAFGIAALVAGFAAWLAANEYRVKAHLL